jgi:hypothetical protein
MDRSYHHLCTAVAVLGRSFYWRTATVHVTGAGAGANRLCMLLITCSCTIHSSS